MLLIDMWLDIVAMVQDAEMKNIDSMGIEATAEWGMVLHVAVK